MYLWSVSCECSSDKLRSKMTHTIALLGLLEVLYLSQALQITEFHATARRRNLQLSCEAKDEVNDESQSSFDAYFNNIKFGYERPPNDKNSLQPYPRSRQTKDKAASQSALCYPDGTRLRGCQTLYSDNQDNVLGNLKLQSLPCVTDGSCPYSQFRCSKGHVWKGVVGSPVCFHCPVCESSRKIYGRKKEATADRLMKSLKLHAVNCGGTLLSTGIEGVNKWNSLIYMKCAEGHDWNGKVGNILLNKTGCFHCALIKKRHGEEEMHQTAEHFGGKFLGFVDSNDNIEDSQVENNETDAVTISLRVRRALWRCAEGHEFNEIAGNIRRPPQGKRKCSWCKACRKNGLEFEWNQMSSEKEMKILETKTIKLSRAAEITKVQLKV